VSLGSFVEQITERSGATAWPVALENAPMASSTVASLSIPAYGSPVTKPPAQS